MLRLFICSLYAPLFALLLYLLLSCFRYRTDKLQQWERQVRLSLCVCVCMCVLTLKCHSQYSADIPSRKFYGDEEFFFHFQCCVCSVFTIIFVFWKVNENCTFFKPKQFRFRHVCRFVRLYIRKLALSFCDIALKFCIHPFRAKKMLTCRNH